MKRSTSLLRLCAVTTALTIPAVGAQAAAFYLQEQSVSGLGSAFAGAGALGEDASTIFYNPAGMTELGGPQAMLGVNILKPSADLTDEGTVNANGAGAGDVSDDGGDPFDVEAVPNFYAAAPLSQEHGVWVGLGVSAPFGLVVDYGDDWFGRYDSTYSELKTIDVAPSVAWQINDQISIGGGINIQYAEAELESSIPNLNPLLGAPDPSTDGTSNLSGDDISAGFNAGILMEPVEGTKIGLHYRSGISHELDGELEVEAPSALTGIPTGTQDGNAGLDLPDIASLSVAQNLNPRWQLLGSINHIGWNNFNSIPVDLEEGTRDTTELNYDDTWSFAIGTRYMYGDNWTFRAGYQYDQTPTKDGFRTTSIPDGDRQWFTTGASYDVNEKWTLDLAAAYIDVSEEDINLDETYGPGAATSSINAASEGDVAIGSVAVTYKF